MRLRIVLGLFAVSLLIFLAGPDGYGQFKGKGNGAIPGAGAPDPAGGGAPVRKGFDMSKAFDFMARGNPSITIADMQGRMKDSLMEFAQEKGITNGQITRDQWLQYSEYVKAKQVNGGLPGMPARNVVVGDAGSAGGPPPGATAEMLKVWADTDFRRFDENGDGKLNQDEMPAALRKELVLWDKNNDGLIDQEEYRTYFITRFEERIAGSAAAKQQNPNAPGMEEDDLDKRPVVYRAGKLPAKGLPPWFKQLDTDNDGQVALYEWRQAGKNLEEFKFWDRDDDGFITPEEALHINAALLKTADPLLASADSTPGNQGPGGFNFPNMGQGNKGGPGGPGRGQFGGFNPTGAQFPGFGNGGQFGGGGGQFGGGKKGGGQFPGFGNGGQFGGGTPPGGGAQMGAPAGGGQFGGGKKGGGGGKKGAGTTPPDGN